MAGGLLAISMSGAAIAMYIYPSIERLISGEISYRVLADPIMGLAVIVLSGSLVQLGLRTLRYSREFVKAQPDSPSKQRDA